MARLSFTSSCATVSSRWILVREAAAWLRRAHGATASHSHGKVKQQHGKEADVGGARLGMASIVARSRRVDEAANACSKTRSPWPCIGKVGWRSCACAGPLLAGWRRLPLPVQTCRQLRHKLEHVQGIENVQMPSRLLASHEVLWRH
ncbi:hypothetical protein SEVIR_1G157701v4 [Setaria viridis]